MRSKILIAAAMTAAVLASCGSNVEVHKITVAGIQPNNDPEIIISQALLKEAADAYLTGECQTEGHIILGLEEKDGKVNVYTITSCGNYQFWNSNFVQISGCGAIPTLFVMNKESSGDLSLDHMEQPADGGAYYKSLKKLFANYLDRCEDISNIDADNLTEQERKYASEYLDKIGRYAEIGFIGDFNFVSLSDAGASDKLVLHASEFSEYPDFVGVIERVNKDVRYSFETQYDPAENAVHFTKRNLNTGEVMVDKVIRE